MTESMITVARIVGDPAHGAAADGDQPNRREDHRGSWRGHSRPVDRQAQHGLALRHRVSPRRGSIKDDLQAIWAGKLESVIWRPVGPAEVIRFQLRDADAPRCLRPGCPGHTAPYPVAP